VRVCQFRHIGPSLLLGAEGRTRTGTVVTYPRILSPVRLPIPPPRLGVGIFFGGGTRIRTGDKGFADLCLTTWLCRRKDGAEDGTRTRDPHLGKVVFYH
jgi:hypothetical protein